ncbi:MAG: transglutaminase domain-containing protein [Methanomassiliicoccus sp.]|nr:transglutaminase domain-containing protein [Methanomassiliicoccus sp.]
MAATKRKRHGVKAAVAVAVVLILVLLLLTPAVQSFLMDLISSPFQRRYPASATFTLERALTVDANGGEIIGYDFDICEPSTVSQNGYVMQEVTSITYDPQLSFREVRYGHSWVGWNGTSISGEMTRTSTVTYQVIAYTHIWNIDREGSLGASAVPSSLQDMYLHDEWGLRDDNGNVVGWMIDTSSPAIVAASGEIVGNETNVYQVLKDIYDWMTANVRYATDASGGVPQTAVETLQRRAGDCDDQSILFCSLARAAGVPAWLQMGALYISTDNAWGGHGWLQAYIPLASGGGENVTIDVVNKDFLVFRPNRFIEFTDDGSGDHLEDYYYPFFTTFDRSTYQGGAAPEFSEAYERLSYEESSKKVSSGGVYSTEIRTACTGRAPLRR